MTKYLSVAGKSARHQSGVNELTSRIEVIVGFLRGVGFRHQEQHEIAMMLCSELLSAHAQVLRYFDSQDKDTVETKQQEKQCACGQGTADKQQNERKKMLEDKADELSKENDFLWELSRKLINRSTDSR